MQQSLHTHEKEREQAELLNRSLVADDEETYDKLRVIAELEEEMREASSRLEFERAAHLRDQIAALKNPVAAAPAQTGALSRRQKHPPSASVFLTPAAACRESRPVFTAKPARPYFEAWLRRTGRQLAVSGRLSQTAMVLAAEDGGCPEEWRSRLRELLDGGEVPSLELLTRIDAVLAGPSPARGEDGAQGSLF